MTSEVTEETEDTIFPYAVLLCWEDDVLWAVPLICCEISSRFRMLYMKTLNQYPSSSPVA